MPRKKKTDSTGKTDSTSLAVEDAPEKFEDSDDIDSVDSPDINTMDAPNDAQLVALEKLPEEIDLEKLDLSDVVPEKEVQQPEDDKESERIIEPNDMIDDPVRMYLREIGRVALLKAKDERALAQTMENGKYVEEIHKTYQSEFGRDMPASDTFLMNSSMMKNYNSF
jgi:RNA polymerase primary sigma factor